jgi:hypothetical protein
MPGCVQLSASSEVAARGRLKKSATLARLTNPYYDQSGLAYAA